MAGKRVGVLALQGAFLEHVKAIQNIEAEAVEVRKALDLDGVDGLIIPGGESTTIGRLMVEFGLNQAIKDRAAAGMPIWGTCAGMILMAQEINHSDQFRLGLIDMRVERNAFGRQVDSFETELEVEGIGKTRGVFIRAPQVEKVWGEARVLSYYQDKIVMVQEEKRLATAFHPELTSNLSLHRYFLDML